MLEDLIKSIPPVTRTIVFLLILGMLLRETGYLNRYDMYFSTSKILQGEVWRLVTCLFFIKQFSTLSILKIYTFVWISSALEKNGFKRGSIDYLYFICLKMVIIYAFAFALSISSLHEIYWSSLLYYYGRVYTQRLILVNFIPIRAPYFIWCVLAVDWIMNEDHLQDDLIGIFIGHCLYFMFKVYHQLSMSREEDKKMFETPQFFVNLVSPLFSAENRVMGDLEVAWQVAEDQP